MLSLFVLKIDVIIETICVFFVGVARFFDIFGNNVSPMRRRQISLGGIL